MVTPWRRAISLIRLVIGVISTPPKSNTTAE